MMKFDQKLGKANTLAERWYLGQGTQTAPLSTSQNPWYYQVAGERVDNIGVTLNTMVNSRSSNQLLLGVDYFNQPFTDAKPNNGAAGVGFIAGVGSGNTYGQPGLAIAGFDGTGGTSVQVRNDYSGHVSDTYSMVMGKHQMRFGGEFRRLEIVEVNTGKRKQQHLYARHLQLQRQPWLQRAQWRKRRILSNNMARKQRIQWRSRLPNQGPC